MHEDGTLRATGIMDEISTMTAARVHEQGEREGVGAHNDAVAVGVAGDGGGGWRGGSRSVLRQEDTEASVRRRRRRGLRHGDVGTVRLARLSWGDLPGA